ncbi:MAG: hypothetical protein AB8I08_23225 [Sandaracinaceae bacterium]
MDRSSSIALALLFACAASTGCAETSPERAPTEPDPEVDVRLEADAWPRWSSAMQVEGCRAAAEEVRRLVAAARSEPRHGPSARRRLAELDVCLDRHRPRIDVHDDRIWRIEMEVEGPDGVERAVPEMRACAAASERRPEGALIVDVHPGRATVRSGDLDAPTTRCLLQAIETHASGSGEARVVLRAGLAYTRPCLNEPSGRRVAVTSVEAQRETEVFLLHRGLRMSSLVVEPGADASRDPRAALRCPIEVDAAHPLGVLAVSGERVVGWAETPLDAPREVLQVGEVRVTVTSGATARSEDGDAP